MGTKWVSDGSPSHSHATKIENNNQFVPVNTNPKEFKKVQKLMKEGRRLGGVHAGPESKVLDGLSWEEVKNMQDAQTSQVDGYGGMKIGAASRTGTRLPRLLRRPRSVLRQEGG